ncbi:hypothetical protein [Vannielia litorea]|uniref:hypothetical protein n=1 Tax=Vannielia litorea TaxID=1217970 RepID=UPI001BCB822A|nr:hypothetical protein [Vannielia litorea]MBS8226606.1 hypothetical protein [Vannielia litorea]
MTRWRWALVVAVLAATLLVIPHLLHREVKVACVPEMALPQGLLAPVADKAGQVHTLAGVDATWHLSGPDSLSNSGIDTDDGLLPWRAENARGLCTPDLPCALKVAAPERFALLWVERADARWAGAMVVQDAPDRRLSLSGQPADGPEDAACSVLAAWFAFARTQLAQPG